MAAMAFVELVPGESVQTLYRKKRGLVLRRSKSAVEPLLPDNFEVYENYYRVEGPSPPFLPSSIPPLLMVPDLVKNFHILFNSFEDLVAWITYGEKIIWCKLYEQDFIFAIYHKFHHGHDFLFYIISQ